MECGALAPLSARDLSPRRKAMHDPALNGGRDKHVPPKNGPDKQVPPKARRGTLVVPAEKEWIIDSVFIGPDKQVPPSL